MENSESRPEPAEGGHTEVSRHAGRYVGRDVDEPPETPQEKDVGAYTDTDVASEVRRRTGQEGEYEDMNLPEGERPPRAPGHYTGVDPETDDEPPREP
ncbi:hypothetical protein AB0J80_04890 [Actinoplanes sp. NPDC049548]|uniref:hypothetical protein n=1 Tax=Actinoplanes sp. NPDC049548 TaxID=3155152 RepID=UPI003444CFFE